MWHLDTVARCPTLQAFLSPGERARVSDVLLQAPSPSPSAATTAAAAAPLPSSPSTAAAASANNSASNSASSDFPMWRAWKLADEHIAQLTAPANDALRALEQRTRGPLRFFARGKRGVLYAGELADGDGSRPVVAKLAAAGAEAQRALEAEARWLRALNRMGVGPTLEDAGPGWLLLERVDGRDVVAFLGADDVLVSPAAARWAVREMLSQCFTMDRMGVNKDEMTHPQRHVLFSRKPSAADGHGDRDRDPGGSRRWRCTLIDFERCTYAKKPKNVTQLCQFLGSPRVVALLRAKGVRVDVSRLRQCSKRYKQAPDARAMDAIMRVFAV